MAGKATTRTKLDLRERIADMLQPEEPMPKKTSDDRLAEIGREIEVLTEQAARLDARWKPLRNVLPAVAGAERMGGLIDPGLLLQKLDLEAAFAGIQANIARLRAESLSIKRAKRLADLQNAEEAAARLTAAVVEIEQTMREARRAANMAAEMRDAARRDVADFQRQEIDLQASAARWERQAQDAADLAEQTERSHAALRAIRAA